MKYQVIGTYYGQSELLFETDYLPDAEAVKIVISEENKYSSYQVGILVKLRSAKFVNMPQFLSDNGKPYQS